MTYKEAKGLLWDACKADGWTMSSPTLKVPHATSSTGVRLWFRPQAIWYGPAGTMHDALSTWVDVRTPAGRETLLRWGQK